MTTHKNFEREKYHLTPLPLELAEKVLAHTREFVATLEQSGASTHPAVRSMVNACTLVLAGLVGQVEAGKVKARLEAGEVIPDEMDIWEKVGMKP